jgi:DNA helicase-4
MSLTDFRIFRTPAPLFLLSPFRQVTLTSRDLTFTSRKSDCTVAHVDVRSLALKRFLPFIHRVTVQTLDTEYPELRSLLSSRSASALRDLFEPSRREAWEELANECHGLVAEAHADLNRYLTRHRYLRGSSVHAWMEFVQRVAKDFHRLLNIPTLPDDYRDRVVRTRSFMEDRDNRTRAHNASFVELELNRKAAFFSRPERKLTDEQRRACVVDEDCTLVVAAAGSGKTTLIVKKAEYLVTSGFCRPADILVLAFNRKAAEELATRLESSEAAGVTVSTIHSLGRRIVGACRDEAPSVHPFAEDLDKLARWVQEQLEGFFSDPSLREPVLQYFQSHVYAYRSPFDFDDLDEYARFVKSHDLRSLSGDQVRSLEELEIANFLFLNGVKYVYEQPYRFRTATSNRRQYQPDFYIPTIDTYLEHFALDEYGNPPKHFARSYRGDVEWKRKIHREHGTRLLETHSYMKARGTLLQHVRRELTSRGLRLRPLDPAIALQHLREYFQVSGFAELIRSFLTLYKGLPDRSQIRETFASDEDRRRYEVFISIFTQLYDAYEQELASNRTIDFADMIREATRYVEHRAWYSPYAYILVDEFQDISPARAGLLQALKRARSDAAMTCVGDDWQSIYRFTGSDTTIMHRVGEWFGPDVTLFLGETFRFNAAIADISSAFIRKNDSQIPKTVRAAEPKFHDALHIVRHRNSADALDIALSQIEEKSRAVAEGKSSVFVLGRYRFSQPGDFRQIVRRHRSLDVNYSTIHSAKGCEADFVVILDLNSGTNGFPARKFEDPLLRLLLPSEDAFPFAEERRLMYVALTRARHGVWMCTNPERMSPFVTELLAYATEKGYTAEHRTFVTVEHCPDCRSGQLVEKRGAGGQLFWACSAFPFCEYKPPRCTACTTGSVLIREGAGHCSTEKCSKVYEVCPRCDAGVLVENSGPFGRFLGCTQFSKSDCRYKRNK